MSPDFSVYESRIFFDWDGDTKYVFLNFAKYIFVGYHIDISGNEKVDSRDSNFTTAPTASVVLASHTCLSASIFWTISTAITKTVAALPGLPPWPSPKSHDSLTMPNKNLKKPHIFLGGFFNVLRYDFRQLNHEAALWARSYLRNHDMNKVSFMLIRYLLF